MNFSKAALENHQFSIIIILILLLLGIVSFITMPRYEDPQVSPAATSIIVVYPGATPNDVEELVINPIEEILNELEDIKTIKSYARDGFANISIEFLAGSDPDDKYSDVTQKVNSIRNKLPSEILDIDLIKWTIADVKILQLALISETDEYSRMEKEAEQLEDVLKKVSGVRSIKVSAYPEQEVRIEINLEKLYQYKIALSQVINIIQSNNANIPGGDIDLGGKNFNIQTSGSFKDLKEIENVVVNSVNGQILFLKDIANVCRTYEDPKYIAKFNNKRAIFISADQKIGTNIFDVSNSLKEKVEEYKSKLPKSMSLETVFDQSQSVDKRLTGFFLNLLQGLILVGTILFLVVDIQTAIIVMLVIPISILIGIGLLDLSRFGLEQMSIAGLVIALGLLVDNAIVVTENISRYIQQGLSNFEAAVKGTSQITWAIISSTLTTILAFVPMMLMQDITGDFIRSMPVTVSYTLLASLLIALTLTPLLSEKFMSKNSVSKERKARKFLNKFVSNTYKSKLQFALDHPKTIIISAVIFFLISLSLFPLVGISFFPKAEKPLFMININLPEGSSISKTEKVANYVEEILMKKEEVINFTTNIGNGNPRIYYNVVSKTNADNYAQIFVELKEYNYDEFNNFLSELRNEFDDFAGAKIEVKDFEQGPPVEAPIAIKILGDDISSLRKISLDVENIFINTEGTVNVNNPLSTTKTDLYVNINKEKAAIYGVPIFEIDRTIRASINGLTISTYRDKTGKEYNIILRSPEGEKTDVEKFDRIYVSSISGGQIPLKQLAKIEFKTSPLTINHFDLARTVSLTSDVLSDYSVNTVTNEIVEKLKTYPFPKGYSFYIGGELESQQQSFGGMAKAMIIAIVGIFGILVLQFRSYKQPLIVFSAIPLAIIGSIIALLLTGNSFSFTAFVGLTSLIGIVVNNSIILVDYTNKLRSEEGLSIPQALITACEIRFIPIILTTGTTIVGLFPLTLGGGTMWAPMGWTIIGGLIMSTFLTLIVVPVLYKLYTK
ncbi:MAG: efflux RND transporter permease subunit [Ignavibacteriales bacterium]|nr:efflux RND transporter permease subunit [Ignavibacteriales bacterium]